MVYGDKGVSPYEFEWLNNNSDENYLYYIKGYIKKCKEYINSYTNNKVIVLILNNEKYLLYCSLNDNDNEYYYKGYNDATKEIFDSNLESNNSCCLS